MTEETEERTPRIGADEIADLLGQHRPTPQQRRVIESPLTPAIVVAGAGSGKTETMAARVLWLLANGLVEAPQILGLTFTRKAAGELQQRLRTRIDELAQCGLAHGYDPFAAPTVQTYNAFANTLYRDHAVRIGRESDGVVLGDASAWQLARQVVVEATDARMSDLDKGVDDITRVVLRLAADLGEHTADPAAVARMAERYSAHVEGLEHGRAAYADPFERWTRPVRALPLLLELVAEFDRRKQDIGGVQYSDQVGLALRILARAPVVGEDLRDRFRVVLLDEYQDTSVVQTKLLSTLFAGTAVMAVGDPHQSIYGWRGASAANLDGFAAAFRPPADSTPYPLSTSWRNGTRILDVANALVEPLTAVTAVPVEPLDASPAASSEPVETRYFETLAEETAHTAAFFHASQNPAPGEPKRSAALLLRTRATMPDFLAAFRERGVRYHVLGVGGLLQEPEVADLVAALRVVHDPGAGHELVRLLAGARWRIGAKDLAALRDLARWLDDRDHAQRRLDDEVRDAFRRSVASGERFSIVEALDFLAVAAPEHRAVVGFSEPGLPRLRAAGALFADLRRRAGGDLPDFVHLVIESLRLDVEVHANERRAASAEALRAFDDALTGFLAVADGATLGAFLGWLAVADSKDELKPRSEPPEEGVVQVLTVHGSKGLEWDDVAVPRFVETEFPTRSKEGSGWLRLGALPWEFRGDAAELPSLAWPATADRTAMKKAVDDFSAEVAVRHEREERRLAYVAVTRARHRLLLTGSWWASQTRPRRPSGFLRELVDRGLAAPLPDGPVETANPAGAEAETFAWPVDPLGGRRESVERAAAAVRAADPAGDAGGWTRELAVLLAEREEALRGPAVAFPSRVPASQFKDYVDDATGVARRLARPMPQRPYRATRLGTLFHSWVEHRSGVIGGTETVDTAGSALDGAPGDAAVFDDDTVADLPGLAELQATFERSEWGGRRPVAVELEVQLPFEGRVVICKIDAVYEGDDGRYEIVDWKTGRAPRDAADLELKQLQLALYRLAFSRWQDVPEDAVDAVFYFVADDVVVRPERIYSGEELRRLWARIPWESATATDG